MPFSLHILDGHTYTLQTTDKGVPLHSDLCPAYDGKRCQLMGFKPGTICQPAIEQIIQERDRLAKELLDSQKESSSDWNSDYDN